MLTRLALAAFCALSPVLVPVLAAPALAQTTTETGGFSPELAAARESFAGSVAIVVARGRHEEDPIGSGIDIDVTVAHVVLQHRHRCLGCDSAYQAFATAWDG